MATRHRNSLSNVISANRAASGLPPDSGSDAIWAKRIQSGTHTTAQASAAMGSKLNAWDSGGTFTDRSGTSTSAPTSWQSPSAKAAAEKAAADQKADQAATRQRFYDQANALFPWMPRELIDTFVGGMVAHGDERVALGLMRQSKSYEQYFPGNRRADGSFVYSEQEYARTIEGYERVMGYYDMPKSVFAGRFGELIQGGVGAEEFQQRIDRKYVEVMSRSDEIKKTYAKFYGLTGLSDAALLASAIDPSMSPAELQLRISRGQVGGAAKESGFDIDLNEASRLQSAGLGYEAAANFYRQAQTLLPTLGQLVERHNDPSDEFELGELTDAVIFSDAEQLRRLNRLTSSEQSLFSGQGTVQQAGDAMTGLRAT